MERVQASMSSGGKATFKNTASSITAQAEFIKSGMVSSFSIGMFTVSVDHSAMSPIELEG